MDDIKKLLSQLKAMPHDDLIRTMKLVRWVLDGEQLGLQLIYEDAELVSFRKVKVPDGNSPG